MRSSRVLLGILLVLMFCAAAWAQDTGSITGTVSDASGAAVAAADVTLTSVEQGTSRTAKTNSSGEYLFAALPAGKYDIKISATGFKQYQAKGVVLRVADKSRVDVALAVGAISEQVTVEGTQVAQVETQSSDLSGTVTGTQISSLALNGRNFTQLVTLVPGVSNQTGQDEGTVGVYGNVAYSINGGRTEYNNWEIDGGDNMDNGSNSTLNVYPNLDAIAEFKVLTSNYGAQYGRNASGTIEVETKSGTKNFHGTADYFGRNEIFNARNFFDDTRPPYKKHDWGYTVGGPVVLPGYNKNRDKTFFFWSEEWRREKNPNTFSPANVPSDAERGGSFSDLCSPAPGVIDSANFPDCPIDPATSLRFPSDTVTVDPVATALLAMLPSANTTNGGFPAYQTTVSTPTSWREELVRVDHNITPNLRATFRFIHDSWVTDTPTTLWSTGTFPTIQTHFIGPGVSVVQRLTANISPTLLNEFVFSYTTDHITLSNNGPWQRPAGMTVGLFQNGFGGKLPGFQVNSGNDAYGDGFGQDPSYIPWKNSNPTYTLRDNVSKIVGKHSLIFGAYAAIGQKNEMDGFEPSNNGFITTDNTSSVSTGNAFTDLLTGRLSQFQQENLQLKYFNRYKILEPYFQDDWRVTNKLTLNLGLRVSLFGTYYEKEKKAFSFEPSRYTPGDTTLNPDGTVSGDPFNGIIQCGGPGIPKGCMTGHLFNPAPRIGFAWDPKGDGKMAIRGGYGIFYEHTNGNEGNTESLEGTPPLVLNPVQNNIDGYANVGSGVGAQLPLAVKSIPSKAIWPYVQQWHLDVQKELPSHVVATVSYVGSKGTHLTLQRNLNQLFVVPASQNPYSPGQFIDTDPTSATFNTDCSDELNPLVNGVAVTGQVATNVSVAACGVEANRFRPSPGYGDITRLEDTANSNYNALQFSARRTVGSLNLSVAYTYSHAIDDSSDRFDSNFVDSYNPSTNRASSNFDQRHILNVSYDYQLPIFKDPGPAHVALGGWRLSGLVGVQTGTPFSVVNGTDFSDAAGVGNGVGTGSFADRTGDPRSGVVRGSDKGPLLYNAAAFVAPQGLTFGNSGRNSLTNPRFVNFDMSLFKHFPIKEAYAFEFRWDAFNVFNHTQFNAIDNSLGSSTFLEATGAHRARTMQFGAKFIF
jgi:hypothetical protein